MGKLLLDENLSPRAAIDLRVDGYDVAHLRERGRLGIADPEVLELAFAEDRVLVTANVGDFRKLDAAREVHAGIVLLLDGGLRRDEQLEVLRRVVISLEADGDLVNRTLTVALDGGIQHRGTARQRVSADPISIEMRSPSPGPSDWHGRLVTVRVAPSYSLGPPRSAAARAADGAASPRPRRTPDPPSAAGRARLVPAGSAAQPWTSSRT